jgi:signal transduction histidine kinase
MKRILGYGSSNHIAEDIDYWKGRVHKEDLFIIDEIIRSPSDAFTLEFRILNKQNEYRWISASGICKFNESGKTLQYSGAAYDITEKKKGEMALEKAKKMAEASLKAKRRFLANVSHEIRTPMHAIMGLSEQLSFSELKPEQAILIRMINDSSKSLMHIINDVLDLSKIEEGKLLIDEVVFDPNKLIKQVFDLFFIEASKKEIGFLLNQNTNESSPLIGDPNRIRQVLSNVISNAIKFTEKGKIELNFRVQKTSPDQAIISFICSDTGIGMSQEMKKRIFEEFVQEDESFHRKYGGSGLGLSITQELVKMMNGQIHIESEKNKGTSVSIEIPLKTIKEKEQKINVDLPPIDLSKLQKIKVLVAEDNEFNRLLLKFIFEKNHIPFEFAFNGRAAVEKVLSQHFDLILMDIQMPEMDGVEATKILRTQKESSIPIIAVTANAVKDELEYYLKNGFNDYLTKPFEERKLLEKMVQFCK